jgi:spermidine synthase
MNRWQQVDSAEIPGAGGELRLFQRGAEFSIRMSSIQGELMNSRTHDSEDALGRLSCQPLGSQSAVRVLIGGLGMGFTLAATLQQLAHDARVTVAELVPDVVTWNRQLLGALAGNPLTDPRVKVEIADVADLIAIADGTYHAILLDVDNGPEGLTHDANDRLYTLQGLRAAHNALQTGGTLAVWSASPSREFSARLKSAGFIVEEKQVRAHAGKGARHIIWLATRAS